MLLELQLNAALKRRVCFGRISFSDMLIMAVTFGVQGVSMWKLRLGQIDKSPGVFGCLQWPRHHDVCRLRRSQEPHKYVRVCLWVCFWKFMYMLMYVHAHSKSRLDPPRPPTWGYESRSKPKDGLLFRAKENTIKHNSLENMLLLKHVTSCWHVSCGSCSCPDSSLSHPPVYFGCMKTLHATADASLCDWRDSETRVRSLSSSDGATESEMDHAYRQKSMLTCRAAKISWQNSRMWTE